MAFRFFPLAQSILLPLSPQQEQNNFFPPRYLADSGAAGHDFSDPVIGVVQFGNREDDLADPNSALTTGFSQPALQLAVALARGPLSNLMTTAQNLAALWRQRRLRAAVLQLDKRFRACTTVRDVVAAVSKIVPDIIGCDKVTFFFHDQQKEVLWCTPSLYGGIEHGIVLDYGKLGREGKSQGVIAHVGLTQEGRISNDPSTDPHWLGDVNPEQFVTANLLTVPVLADVPFDVSGSPVAGEDK